MDLGGARASLAWFSADYWLCVSGGDADSMMTATLVESTPASRQAYFVVTATCTNGEMQDTMSCSPTCTVTSGTYTNAIDAVFAVASDE